MIKCLTFFSIVLLLMVFEGGGCFSVLWGFRVLSNILQVKISFQLTFMALVALIKFMA